MTTQSFKLLFVCTGNIARSPLAEAWAQVVLSQNGPSEVRWHVDSAGTHAVNGDPVRPEVQKVASASGLDLSSFKAHLLTPQDCETPELILAMSWDQVAHIWSLVPESYERCFTIKEFVHWARQAATAPPIMFPDKVEHMRDKVRRTHAIRKRARADSGFWGGLRPEDLDLVEPDPTNEQAWAAVAQGIRALVTDSIKLVGGP